MTILCVGITGPAAAQVSAPFDTARMERDLNIMNAILDRLVFEVPGSLARVGGDATKGIYLPDYGVIFFAPRRSSLFQVYSITLDNARRQVDAEAEMQKKASRAKAGEGIASTYEYRTADKRDRKVPLIEFFSKYADAIGQLDDSERIAIYSTSGSNVFYSFGGDLQMTARGGAESSPEDLLAVARKADIVALRSGKIKADDFTGRIVFKDIDTEAANADIDIMAGIIDRAFQTRRRTNDDVLLRTSNTHGIYLDDFGAIFFTEATYTRDMNVQILQTYERQAAEYYERAKQQSLEHRLTTLQKASEQRRESWWAGYKKFKQQLGDLIVDYGHTLRQLNPQDNIVITANLDNAGSGEGPDYLVCRIKKQQVEAFNARRITREQLLNMIVYNEY